MNIPFQSKLPAVGTTIFTEMSALANEYHAINLGQGFPDFTMDETLADLVSKAMKDGFNQYAPMPGYLPLREAIAAKVFLLYGMDLDSREEITITPGGTYAIYSAITTVIRPGDEVIVFEPAYDSYIPNIEINGGIAVRIPLVYPGYSIDWQRVANSITAKTKMIIINSPHNPTGSILTQNDLQQLSRLVEGKQIFIVSDEVYEHLVYDGKTHESILRYPGLYRHAFVCFSFGKVYHCTGWKMGYCIAPPQLTKEFRKVHQFNCFSVNSPMQVALASFLQQPSHYLDLAPFMQFKRNYLRKLMVQTPMKLISSGGSYFEMYSYEGLSEENEKDLAIRMVKECGLATIPVSAFYQDATDHKVLRFCFAKKESTLDEAISRLLKFNFMA